MDIFVSSWWSEGQSAPYEADIVNYFLGGGNLLLLQDGPDRDGISTQLGFQTIDGTANPTTVSGAVNSGPFGAVGAINQNGQVGHFDNATITGLGGEIFGLNALGQATIVGFKAGVLGATAGALIAFADVDMIADYGTSSSGANYAPGTFAPVNAPARAALNSTDWLLNQQVAAVPLPASLPLMFAALGGLGLLARRRRKTA